MPIREGEEPDDELLSIIRDRDAKGDRPLGFTEHGELEAVGLEGWDDPVLWEMLSREQVERQKGAAIKKLTPEVVARAREESKQMGDVARKFIKAGMKLVFGSDNGAAGRGYGWYNQMEFESWIDMGVTPMEAIVMATRDAGEIGGFNTGLVAPGKRGDFIVLEANPLLDITNSRRINKVYLLGKQVDRCKMRASWQSKRKTAAP